MNKTEINKLLKEAKAKVEPGYIKIRFGYGAEFVFPYKAGITVVEAFEQAEEMDNSDYDNKAIVPIKTSPEIKILTRSAYVEMKMTHLLGLNTQEKTE